MSKAWKTLVINTKLKFKIMTEAEYNGIAMEYQFLIKRSYTNFQNYDGCYKCYDPKAYGVRDEYLELLNKFQGYTLRHVFTLEHIESHPYPDNYLDAELLILEENRICVHQELAMILFHVLAYKLHDGISGLLNLLEKIRIEHPKYFTIDEQQNIYALKMYRYDEFIAEFENLPDYTFIVHLFNRTGSDVITVNLQNEIEFKVYKIKRIFERFKNFNFGNLPI